MQQLKDFINISKLDGGDWQYFDSPLRLVNQNKGLQLLIKVTIQPLDVL